MTELTTTEPEVDEAVLDEGDQPEPDPVEPGAEQTDEPETFPREYVEKLRQENGRYRQKAADRDEIAERLHVALVAATGRLAAPDELPFDEAHLSDPEALTTALDDLLARKPYLAARKPAGDVGQGASPAPATVDLAGIIRTRAS